MEYRYSTLIASASIISLKVDELKNTYVYIWFFFNNYKQNLVGNRLTPVLTSAIQVVPEDQFGDR